MTYKPPKPTILCISTYEKGQPFLIEAAGLGVDVLLLTVDKLANADWPRDALHKFLTMPENLTPEQVLNTLTYQAREIPIHRIVALDEFDLESAAHLREHMRLPGMGESATRFFRDKLAMRIGARQGNVPVPDFTPVLLHEDLRHFMHEVPGPWLLKPRTNASAIGIRTIDHADQLWPILDELGDLQSHYLLERFVPGDIFHVEGIHWEGETLFAAPCQYGQPPMQTMHRGGVFTTRTLSHESPDAHALERIHRDVISALGLVSGVTHTEFIKAHGDGRFYFLETAARVGGAHIADLIQHATGINPWIEWARIEVASLLGHQYTLPAIEPSHAGSIISLARQEWPDTGAYNDPEIVYRLRRHHHVGLIVRSPSASRIQGLVEQYTARFLDEFCAVEPPPDKPSA